MAILLFIPTSSKDIFSHTDMAHNLLDLYMCFIFGGANVNGIVYLISDFVCLLMIDKKND